MASPESDSDRARLALTAGGRTAGGRKSHTLAPLQQPLGGKGAAAGERLSAGIAPGRERARGRGVELGSRRGAGKGLGEGRECEKVEEGSEGPGSEERGLLHLLAADSGAPWKEGSSIDLSSLREALDVAEEKERGALALGAHIDRDGPRKSRKPGSSFSGFREFSSAYEWGEFAARRCARMCEHAFVSVSLCIRACMHGKVHERERESVCV